MRLKNILVILLLLNSPSALSKELSCTDFFSDLDARLADRMKVLAPLLPGSSELSNLKKISDASQDVTSVAAKLLIERSIGTSIATGSEGFLLASRFAKLGRIFVMNNLVAIGAEIFIVTGDTFYNEILDRPELLILKGAKPNGIRAMCRDYMNKPENFIKAREKLIAKINDLILELQIRHDEWLAYDKKGLKVYYELAPVSNDATFVAPPSLAK